MDQQAEDLVLMRLMKTVLTKSGFAVIVRNKLKISNNYTENKNVIVNSI